MDLEAIAALVMLLGLTAYMLLGGADFGGGVWVLLAPRGRAGDHQDLIAQAIGPVWEANHVWLIFVIVLLFSGFPSAFAAISTAFFALFHFVLLGIILRGSAFVFRSYGPREDAAQRLWTGIFGAASIITPFLLGLNLAAVSTGGIRVIDGQVRVDAGSALWAPFPMYVGLLALALSAYLAAVYLTLETRGRLQDDFRWRAMISGVVAGALALLALYDMPRSAPYLWENFHRVQAAPLLTLGLVAGLGALIMLWRRLYGIARILAVTAVTVLLWGWGFAQWPYIVYPDLTFYNTAAPPHVLAVILEVLPAGMVLLLPSLWLLFRVFKGHTLVEGEPEGENPGRK